MIHKAKDLSQEEKLALERLLGQAISDQEEISVRLLKPTPEVSPERRRQILDGLRSYFSEVDSQRKQASAEEADEILNEALRSTRPNYRPVD